MEGKTTLNRIAEHQAHAVSDLELLSALVNVPVIVANNLLERFGSIAGMVRASPDELATVIGRRKATLLLAGLELGRRSTCQPDERARMRFATEVASYYGPRIGGLGNEVFHIACLDVRNRLLRDARIAAGGFASCAILPREVFAPALAAKAVAVILVHNHPSGETEPSADDLQLTHRLVRAGEVLGIQVLDHVIVAQGAHTSMAERGQLK
jgi:DNA repair protein RadC